jgi:Flp pilus assembly protein TadG
MLINKPQARRRHGAAAVECAVIMTVLVPMLLGTWEVGRLVQVQQLLQNAAREGGRQCAAGFQNAASIKQHMVTMLNANGIPCTASNVTITNLTNSARSDPTSANQLDEFQVTVSIPFNSVRWVLLQHITPTTQLTATTYWYSVRDLPLNINTTIPLY